MKKKLFAILMALTLVLTFMPAMAFAEDDLIWTTYPIIGNEETSNVQIRPDESVDLEIGLDAEGEYDLTYAWYTVEWDEEGNPINTPISGASGSKYTGAQIGSYLCVVKDSQGKTDECAFEVSPTDPDDIVFTPVPNKEVWDMENLIINGDKLTLQYGDTSLEYVYSSGKWMRGKSECPFAIYSDYDEWPDNFGEDFNYKVYMYGYEDHEFEKTGFSAKYVTSIKSATYNTSSITLWGPDVFGDSYVDDSPKPVEGYIIETRAEHKKDGLVNWSAFVAGDKITVTYKDGKNDTFVNKDIITTDDETGEKFLHDEFLNAGGEYLDVHFEYVPGSLKAGNNTVKLYCGGAYTNVNVFIDTPELKAAREKATTDTSSAAAEAKAKADAIAAASNVNKATVSAADIKKASDLGVTSITFGTKVKKIKKNAFKGTKIKTVTVKTKKLTAKSVKGSLKGSKVKTIKVKVGNKKTNKKFVKKYKKIFTKKNAGRKATVK